MRRAIRVLAPALVVVTLLAGCALQPFVRGMGDGDAGASSADDSARTTQVGADEGTCADPDGSDLAAEWSATWREAWGLAPYSGAVDAELLFDVAPSCVLAGTSSWGGGGVDDCAGWDCDAQFPDGAFVQAYYYARDPAELRTARDALLARLQARGFELIDDYAGGDDLGDLFIEYYRDADGPDGSHGIAIALGGPGDDDGLWPGVVSVGLVYADITIVTLAPGADHDS
ncbi:hypothetical protein [Schumannella sp. 10F1B-5-1]|uniref:hypothetical protein n=1 Tax=Schumannella sp. 10F1B-5-1 TaxID=2590780 RepID=UPI0011304D9C|nr:hypothetical protein [Schumannella sp. 10F1B-5-1]TPW70999.1 hypothetical protein FJ658_12955 [Schumannella sp. 10F1B-5-1]